MRREKHLLMIPGYTTEQAAELQGMLEELTPGAEWLVISGFTFEVPLYDVVKWDDGVLNSVPPPPEPPPREAR